MWEIVSNFVAFLENLNFKIRNNFQTKKEETNPSFFAKAKQSRNDSNSPHWSLNHVHEVHGKYKVVYQVL